jgi:hypothetical protein
MEFNFLKEIPKELNSNVYNTFGIKNGKFFVSYENEIILVYDDLLSRQENDVISLYQRYDFKKAFENHLSANIVDAPVSIGNITEVLEKSFTPAGKFDGKKLVDPSHAIGNGNCGYAFVQKDGKLYLSVPSKQIIVVSCLCDSDLSFGVKTIDLKGAFLLKNVFGECGEVEMFVSNSYLKFVGNGKTVYLKTKSYNGSYSKHTEVFKIIAAYPKTELNKDVIAAAVNDYKFDDFMNTDIERIPNTAYSFHIDSDKMDAVCEDSDFSNNSYLNHGRQAPCDINFVSSFEVLDKLLNIFDKDLQYITGYDTERRIDGVDPNWWDIGYSFFSSNEKPYLAAYIV